MLWLKRNMWTAVAGLAAVVLIGLGAYYLWAQIQENKTINDELDRTKAELDTLDLLEIRPTAENLEVTRRELARAKSFVGESRRLFPLTPTESFNNQTYKSFLETTIAQLRKEALAGGVKLHTNYNFSFEAQIGPVNFEPASLKPLSEQMIEIKQIASALFQAKIEQLDQIRRVAVSSYDAAASSDILPGSYTLNKETGMAVWPYEFRFACFSPALAGAIESISRVPSGVIIKSVAVEPMPPAPVGRVGPPLSINVTNKLSTVLDEKVLQVTLLVNVIKPVPPSPPPPR